MSTSTSWLGVYEPGSEWPALADSGPPEPGNLTLDQVSEPT